MQATSTDWPPEHHHRLTVAVGEINLKQNQEQLLFQIVLEIVMDFRQRPHHFVIAFVSEMILQLKNDCLNLLREFEI